MESPALPPLVAPALVVPARGLFRARDVTTDPLEPVPPGPALALRSDFRNWFGGSRICMRETGEPVVFWRGDSHPIPNYTVGQRHNVGLFLALEKARAACYGPARPFVVRAENPLDLRDPLHTWMQGGIPKGILQDIYDDHYRGRVDETSGEEWGLDSMLSSLESGDLWRSAGDGGWKMPAWRDLQQYAFANGYDALLVPDNGEGVGTGLSLAVKDGRQLKLTTAARFDPENPEVAA